MTKEEKYPINGYAPGNYFNVCHSCKEQFLGDKLAVTCKSCAIEAAYVYLTAEITRLREALDKIANPLKFIQEDADKNGMVVDGYQANLLINNASYLKGIAKEALKPDNSK